MSRTLPVRARAAGPVWAILLATIAGALILGAFSAPNLRLAHADDEVRLVITSGQPSASGLTTVSIAVDGLPADRTLNGYELLLRFDPVVARIVSVEPQGTWDIGLVPPLIDAAAGTVRITAILLEPSCGAGCGLATVTFAGVGSGGAFALTAPGVTLAARGFEVVTTLPPAVEVVVPPSSGGPALPFTVFAPSLTSDGAQ